MTQRINIICVSGTHEKLQMAAMIASVAAATGVEVSVFFSMNAIPYFIKGDDSSAPSEGNFGDLMSKQGVPPFKQLFKQAADLGEAKLLPCSMAVDLLKLSDGDLEPEFSQPMGLTRFLSDAEGSQLLTF